MELMAGNNGKGNIPERDLWQTPQDLWNQLNKQYYFTIDCCANKENTKTQSYYDVFEITIKEDFKGDQVVAWMNPPFSKAYEMFKQFFEVVSKGVAIYRCDNMETKIWQELILPNCSWIFIPKGRIHYEGIKGKVSRFPSALIGFNVSKPKGLKGHTVIIKK